MKLSKGDAVIVITGKDKGKKGTIVRVLASENRVVVTGINMVTKHIKKTAQNPGSVVKFERSIHASNVMILDPKTGKGSRIGYKREGTKKIRVARKSGTPLERNKNVKAEETKLSAAKAAPKSKSFWGSGKSAGPEPDAAGARTEAEGVNKATVHVRSAGRGS
ncbi:MAG: 50S ribosomal protein L24 [Candidatus Peribacteraceae bacterium]